MTREVIGAVGESAWLAGLASVDPATPATPGVTLGDLVTFHRRRRTPPGARFRLVVPYGKAGAAGRPLTLTLYARKNPQERRPAVVFVHGGGWTGGDPYFHIRHATALAARGCVTATISYRVYPEARWPQPLEDVKAAIRWVRANAGRIGADPDRIAVAGGSAGGHLSAWAALAPGQYEGTGGNPDVSSAVQAACLWYPAVELNAMHFAPEMREGQDTIELFFGAPGAAGAADRQAASPLHAVRPGAPPILTMTGSADELTPLAPIEEFHRRLTTASVPNELVVVDGRDHGFDIWTPADWQGCFDRMAAFFDDALTASGSSPRVPVEGGV